MNQEKRLAQLEQTVQSLIREIKELKEAEPNIPCGVLTIDQVARDLGRSRSFANDLFHSMGFPSFQINSAWFVDTTEYWKWRADITKIGSFEIKPKQAPEQLIELRERLNRAQKWRREYQMMETVKRGKKKRVL